MNLDYTAEQVAIRDSVVRFCAQNRSVETGCRVDRHGEATGLWKTVADLGWFGLGVPGTAGGSGLGLTEVACFVEAAARGLAPLAILEAATTAFLVSRIDPSLPILPALGRGEAMLAFALDEYGYTDPRKYRTRIDAAGNSITGKKDFVSTEGKPDWHLVAARDGEEIALVLVRCPDVVSEERRTLDGTRQAQVVYDQTPIVARLTEPGRGWVELSHLREVRRALAIASMLGSMEAALAMTVAYVKEREQFGQKIAVFQAVQHQVADMATMYTAARRLGWQAITRLAEGKDAAVDLATACAFVGPAAKRLTLTAHHLHGGAGYVVEHALHYHSERVQALSIRYAPEGPSLSAIAASLLD